MIKYIIQRYKIISRQKKGFLDTLSKSVQKIFIMTNDNRRANTKKAIQEAMVALLKTESFDDITTIKIAKEAGISRSSFYTHYKDKFELIDSVNKPFSIKLNIFLKNTKAIKNKRF